MSVLTAGLKFSKYRGLSTYYVQSVEIYSVVHKIGVCIKSARRVCEMYELVCVKAASSVYDNYLNSTSTVGLDAHTRIKVGLHSRVTRYSYLLNNQ